MNQAWNALDAALERSRRVPALSNSIMGIERVVPWLRASSTLSVANPRVSHGSLQLLSDNPKKAVAIWLNEAGQYTVARVEYPEMDFIDSASVELGAVVPLVEAYFQRLVDETER